MIDHEYTLSALLQIVQHGMQELFGSFPFWCIAEIAKCKLHSGRVYLDLIELDDTGAVTAQARAVVRQESIVREYCRNLGISDIQKLVGAKVCMKTICGFHPQYGFSLTVQEFSLAYAQGLEQQQRARAREALIAQGIFDKNKTKNPGFPPLKIAVISSESAEGLRDFLTILEQGKYAMDVHLHHSTMHGNTAKNEILAAFSTIEKEREGMIIPYNMICLVRGGGGKEGFARSNDPDIAAQVCKSSLPVVTAIGHTIDDSLLDEIAWHAAKTPSDAAHYIIGYVAAYDQSAQKRRAGVQQRLQLTARHLHERVQMRTHAIYELLEQRLVRSQQQVQHWYSTVTMADPRRQLTKGYALLQRREGEYLNADDIKHLQKDEKIRITVYDTSIDVTVEKVNP